MEFVAGQDKSFYFLEMNTRLQVEHPVTEMITGLDLVELMIRVAAGEALPLAQDDVKLNGWAVESRVYAEDPTRNFLPSIGRLTTYRPPAEGQFGAATVRNDTGVEEGGEIAIHYDPMIAKLVTWAPTRAEAIESQGEALDAFAIDGIRHNIPFLAALMAHPRWRSGNLSTGFIAEEFPEGFVAPEPKGEIARRMAAVAAAIDHKMNQRKRGISGQMRDPGLLHFERDRVVVLAGESYPVTVESVGGTLNVKAEDGNSWAVSSDWRPGEPVWQGEIAGTRVAMQVRGLLKRRRPAACGRGGRRAGLHAARGGARRPDAGQGGCGLGQAGALPDAGPRQGDPGQGRPGGEERRGAGHRRGHEDGERAARRARRDGRQDRRQGGRQPRRRCGDPGIRLTPGRPMPLYFAYGANMDAAAMAARCPRSTLIGQGRLNRHRFIIMREGYASVLRDPRACVWGVIWDLSLSDVPALDRYEGVASGLYAKATQPVSVKGGSKRALIYLGRSSATGAPRQVTSNRSWPPPPPRKLPPAYRSELQGWLRGR